MEVESNKQIKYFCFLNDTNFFFFIVRVQFQKYTLLRIWLIWRLLQKRGRRERERERDKRT